MLSTTTTTNCTSDTTVQCISNTDDNVQHDQRFCYRFSWRFFSRKPEILSVIFIFLNPSVAYRKEHCPYANSFQGKTERSLRKHTSLQFGKAVWAFHWKNRPMKKHSFLNTIRFEKLRLNAPVSGYLNTCFKLSRKTINPRNPNPSFWKVSPKRFHLFCCKNDATNALIIHLPSRRFTRFHWKIYLYHQFGINSWLCSIWALVATKHDYWTSTMAQ